MTTPIDVSELSYVRPLTIPIDRSQIMSSMPLLPGGTAVAPRSWFGRVFGLLRGRN